MAGITLAQAEAQLATWLNAITVLATSQEFEIETANGSRRRLRRANLAEAHEMVKYWNSQVQALTVAAAGGRIRTRYVVPE